MPNHKSSTFSINLRSACATRGMTQEELAREMDMTLRTVQNWVSGSKEPNGSNLVRLAKVLRRSPGWFYEDHEAVAA